MNTNIFSSKEETVSATGEYLNNLLLKNKKLPVLLLLSGGSALSILDYINGSSMGENLTITMLDERFSQNPEINNFLKLQKTEFYSIAQEANANFIGTLPRSSENLDDMQTRLEISLKNWMSSNPNGKIFAVFGMGADGHTAGIFPFPEDPKFFSENFENSKWVAGYNAQGKTQHPERITTTFTFFKLIDEAILFVCGKEKKEKYKELLTGKNQPHTLPAVGIFETKNFQIFTDISE